MINYNDDPNVNASHEDKNHPNFQSAIVCFMKFLQKINKQQEDRLQQHLVHLNTDMTASMKQLINQQKLILERQESLHEKLQALETKFEDLERNLLTQLFQTNNNETNNEIDQACDIDLSTRPSVTPSENMEDDVFDPDAIESSQSYPTSTESNEGLLTQLSQLIQPQYTNGNSTHIEDMPFAPESPTIDIHESMDSELECEYDNHDDIDDVLQNSEKKSTNDNFENSVGENQDFERESENDTIESVDDDNQESVDQESVDDDNQESVDDDNHESEDSPIQAQAIEEEDHSNDNPCSKFDALESQSESNHDLKVTATPQIFLMPNKKTVFSSFEDLKKSQNNDASTSLPQEQSTQIQSHTHVARSSSFPSIKTTFNPAHTSEIRHTYTENNYVEKVRNIPEGQKTLDDSKTDYRDIRTTFMRHLRARLDPMKSLELAVGTSIFSTDQIRRILKDNGIGEKQFFSSPKFIMLNNQYWIANNAKGNYRDVRNPKYKLKNDWSNTKTTSTSSNTDTTESKTVLQSVRNDACQTQIIPANQKTLNDFNTDYDSILTDYQKLQANRFMTKNAETIKNFEKAIKYNIFSLKKVELLFTKFGFDITRFHQSKNFVKLNEEYWMAEFAAKGNYIDVRSKDDNS